MYPADQSSSNAVLFDLDGTLFDTAGDLIAAVNRIRHEDGYEPILFSTLRPWVSQGGLKLVSRAYGLPTDSDQIAILWQRYLVAYESNISQHTVLFPGWDEILYELESESRPWGIVTNKPTYLTHKLLQEMGMQTRPACVVCGDSASRSKPFPEPVHMACQIMGVPPERTLMVGDDKRDIMAAKSAGADAVAAAWGYIRPDDDPASWGASAVLTHPGQLKQWVGRDAGHSSS